MLSERWFRVLDWLLPPRCGSCRQVGAWLCAACLAGIRPLVEPLCPRCGVEVEFAGASCACRHRFRALARLRSAATYSGPLERALHRFKYEGWRWLAPALAGLAWERLSAEVREGTLLLPVPLHPRRRRSRGYNQSELLAAELARRSRPAPNPGGGLVRTRDTPPQVGQDRLHRRANVAGAFTWRGPGLDGTPVILVDDVVTTGSTLEACAAALRAAASGPVTAITVARVLL